MRPGGDHIRPDAEFSPPDAPDWIPTPTCRRASPLTAFQIGLRRWVDSESTEAMDELVDQAFAMITPVFDLSTDPN